MPHVLIINAANNVKKFENALAAYLEEEIRSKSHWTVTTIQATDFSSFSRIQTGYADAVLLIAHGHGTSGSQVAGVATGTELISWYLAASALEVEGKALLLCVCEGYNRDMIEGILREQMPTAIIGKADGSALTNKEARDFFPPLFALATTASLLGEVVTEIVRETNVSMEAWLGLPK